MVDVLTADLVPDSRCKVIVTPKNAINCGQAGFMVPIFCANCGGPGGQVPEKNMTFAYYLCTPCWQKLGDVVGTYAMPDEVFFERVRQEQLESYGRYLTAEEMLDVVAADASPLAKLLKEGR